MKWIKSQHGGFRSEDGQFYLQLSPKKFWRLFRKGAENWAVASPPLKTADEGKQLAASLAA